MNTTKEAYRTKMEAQLKVWSTRFEAFKAEADKTGAEAKIELLKRLDELKAFETSAKQHIAKVESSATTSWDEAKGEIEKGWDQLSGSIDALWAGIWPKKSTKN